MSESMWDDWEGLTEEEIDSCFAPQPTKDPIHCCKEPGCSRTFHNSKKLTEHIKSHVPPKFLCDPEAKMIFENAIKLCEPLALPKAHLKLNLQTLETIKSIGNSFYKHRNLDKFYSQYPDMSMNAGQLLQMPQAVAAQFLIKLFDAIVAEEEEKKIASIAGINGRETEIIEYIGGYLLKKFSGVENGTICKLLMAEKPKGDFIKSMEISAGKLLYPFDDFVGILHRVYHLQNNEVGKNCATQIDLARVLVSMETDPYYAKFINTLHYQSGWEEEKVKELLDEILCTFVNAIGRRLAQFIKQKFKPESSKYTKGLRKDLAALCSK